MKRMQLNGDTNTIKINKKLIKTFRVILRQQVIWSTYYVKVRQSYGNNANTITVIQTQ
jgi:hypothetical protein